MVERQTEKAVIAALTPICVAEFKSEPKQEQVTNLAALEEEGFWERGDFVEKQGWATMPGSKNQNAEVAEACAAKPITHANKK